MSTTPAPCPFCGSHEVGLHLRQGTSWVAACATCGAFGPVAKTQDDARSFWGHRSKTAAQAALEQAPVPVPGKVRVHATMTKRSASPPA